MRITSKGQVTIPAHIREQAGLLPHTEVEFEFDGETVRLVKATAQEHESRGDRIVRRMWKRSPGRMSTEEILALMRDDWRDDRNGEE